MRGKYFMMYEFWIQATIKITTKWANKKAPVTKITGAFYSM